MRLTSLLVALHYPNSSNLLKAATELAHKSRALLKAYYLENVEWFEASKISFSSQVSGFKGEILPLTEEQISRESNALAERLKKMFVSYGEQFQIKYIYRFVRGNDDKELQSAASEVDMVMIKRNNRLAGRNRGLGITVRSLISNCTVPLLIWNENSHQWPRSIIGICRDAESGGEVVSWTLEMSDILGQALYFFWQDETELENQNLSRLMEKEGLSRYTELVRERSEHYPVSVPDYLKSHQKAVIVMKRPEREADFLEFVQQLPNTFLLI